MQNFFNQIHHNAKKLIILIVLLSLTTFTSLVAIIVLMFTRNDEIEIREIEKIVYVTIAPTVMPTTIPTITTTEETNSKNTEWNTYTNEEIGYTVSYPNEYSLKLSGEKEDCIYLKKGDHTSINIGRQSRDNEPFGCFRTGVGAYEIDYTNQIYTINKRQITVNEWYEHTEWYDDTEEENSKFGIIYGMKFLDIMQDGTDWGFEYWGEPEEFKSDRVTVKKILESITWK